METKLLNQEGKEIGTIELNDSIFSVPVDKGLMHRLLMLQLANARQSNAHTKTRGDRRGSTRKIYKQKGTGKARAGSARSPVRKKGGVGFGPKNTTNYTISMNKKERRLALFSALSSKLRTNSLIVVDSISLAEIKTKSMVSILSNLPYTKSLLLAIPGKDDVLQKSISNIPYAKYTRADYLNIADLLKYDTLVLLKDSVKRIEEVFLK
ncbi:MAG: 50S ribosomal protein L4 [Candidatus Gracilibacteria bacterium]|nr:50S ribosomal protein L4 [Candidatus Gracilibacteria bacterium]